MSEWELTNEELAELQQFEEPADQSIGYERNIATAAVQKLLEHLAKQVGPIPKERCEWYQNNKVDCADCAENSDCPLYQFYLGQQSVLGIQEGRKHE